jgi:hypothetical protein
MRLGLRRAGRGGFLAGVTMLGLMDILCKKKQESPQSHLGGRKLSCDMQAILFWMATQYRAGNIGDSGQIAWPPDESWTRREQAAMSRSLRRLEDRGLVVRLNMKGYGKRTSHVEFTLAGAEVAAKLK